MMHTYGELRIPASRRAFEVFEFDGAWHVHCPDGCVMVGGEQAVVKNRDEDDCVAITLGDDDTEVWGHVRESATGGWEVTFDAVAPASESASGYNFLVKRFSQEVNDGRESEICTSAINFGGSGGAAVKDKGPFPLIYDKEDEEDEEETPSLTVGDGYIQVGGFTVQATGGLPAAPVLTAFTGFVCVRVNATTIGWANVTFATYPTFAAMRTAQEDLGYVTYPLYEMYDGAVVMDLRRMPSTGILEFYAS